MLDAKNSDQLLTVFMDFNTPVLARRAGSGFSDSELPDRDVGRFPHCRGKEDGPSDGPRGRQLVGAKRRSRRGSAYLVQVTDANTGVISWINADLVTHIVPKPSSWLLLPGYSMSALS